MEQVFTVSLLDGGPKQNGVRSPYITLLLTSYTIHSYATAVLAMPREAKFTGGSLQCHQGDHLDEIKKYYLPVV